MIRLLQCEWKKTRRRYLILTALAITVLQLCWIFYGKHTEETLKNGWIMLLYQVPLLNAIFLPLLTVVVASRLCDIEHKGKTLKQVCCAVSKGRLYDAKMLYGFGIILLCILVQLAAIALLGSLKGFQGVFPVEKYLLYGLFTAVPALTVYIIQQTLSLLYKNQAISFFTGVTGEFIGVMLMFFPPVPVLRLVLPWYYFGALQFVGMDWSREIRISSFYYTSVNWTVFAAVLLITGLLYVIGRKLFCEREV